MAKCKFEIPLNTSAEIFLEKVKLVLAKAGGELNGDTTNGTILLTTPLGKIVGDYEIAGTEATITITQKPMILSCNNIEKILVGALTKK